MPVRGKTYRLQVLEPGTHTVELSSYFFDAYLVLRDVNGQVLTEDDDGLLATDSRLLIESLQADTEYRLQVCALHGELGAFELRFEPGRPQELSAEEERHGALAQAREAVAVRRRVRGDDDASVASSLMNLGRILSQRREFAEAEPFYLEAIAIRDRELDRQGVLYENRAPELIELTSQAIHRA